MAKRFRLDTECIIDMENNEVLSNTKAKNLLNKQHEQIQSLQFQLKECRENKLYSRRELEKENEQLKKSIECQNEMIKEQCMKIEWASECGVKWDKEFKEWSGVE